jgi:hypothetical protein
MVELTLRTEKNKNPSIAADLGEAGVHVFVDRGFFARTEKIGKAMGDYLTDEEIDRMGLTPVRARILKQAMRKLAYVWEQFAYGKAGDKPRLASAFSACREMVLLIEECIESDCSDKEVELLCRERLSYIDIPVLYTFDEKNTTVNKSFVVHNPMPMRPGEVLIEGQESSPE